MAPLQILKLHSPIQFESNGDTLSIKGFVSVAMVDRSNEYVDPLEFDVKTFMAAPTLYENHKPVFDEFANEVAAGKVVFMEPAYVSKMAEDEAYWEIASLIDGRTVNTLLRDKVPRLREGDKGLFIVAEVSHPLTISRIRKGELGGLSWMGFVHSINEVSGIKRLGNVDLVEVSVVNTPDNNQSTFMIGKSLDGGTQIYQESVMDSGIFRMRFDKQKFNKERIQTYLQRHRMNSRRLVENDSHYFAEISEPSNYQIAKAFAVKCGEATAILAPMIKNEEVLAEFIGDIQVKELASMSEKSVQRLYLVDEAQFIRLPGCKTQLQKSAKLEDGTDLEIHTLEIEEVTETPTEEKPVDFSAQILEEIKRLNERLSPEQVSEEVENQETEETKVSKELEEAVAQKNAELEKLLQDNTRLKEAFESNEQKLELVLKALKGIVPETSVRSENVRSKSIKKEESVADLFKSVLPFGG